MFNSPSANIGSTVPVYGAGEASAGGGGTVTDVTGTLPITSTGGATPDIAIDPATALAPGSMSAADFAKLAGITPGAGVVAVAVAAPATLGGTAANPIVGVQTFGAAQAGAVPLSGGGVANFLRADGTWVAPTGTGVTSVSGTAPIASSGGVTPAISITAATAIAAGSMSAADKAKLDAITTTVSSVGATAPVTTTGGLTPTIGVDDFTAVTRGTVPLSGGGTANFLRADGTWVTPAGTGVSNVTASLPITSSGGATPDIAINPATILAAGSLSAADKTKLDSITSGAAVASVGATAPITSSGGTTPSIGVTDFSAVARGTVPLSGGGVANFLRADGTWTAPAGTGVTSVGGTAPIVSSGGLTPAISITPADGASAGSMSSANFTKLAGIGAGANVVSVAATSPATLGGTAQNPSIGVQTFGAAQAGAVPLSGGGTANFLRADGTWAAPPGSSPTVLKQTVFLEIAADTTTASGAFVDLLSQAITTGANFLIVDFTASFSNSQGLGIYQSVDFQLLVDGVVKRGGSVFVTAGVEYCAALVYRQAISAAAHTVKIQWRTSGATARCRPVTTVLEHASLLLSEVTA